MSDWTIAGLLVLGILAYLVVGLAPFNFDFSRPVRPNLFFITPLNGFLNWACFIPIGALIASFSFVERPLLAAGLCCGFLCCSVECLQLFLPGRFATVSDWMLNVGGAVTGALLVSSVLTSASLRSTS